MNHGRFEMLVTLPCHFFSLATWNTSIPILLFQKECCRYDETFPILLRHLENAFKPVRLCSVNALSNFLELGNLTHSKTGSSIGLDVVMKMISFIDFHLHDVRLEEYAGKKIILFIPDSMLQAMLSRSSTGESEQQPLPKYRRRTGSWGCCLDCSPSDKARRPWKLLWNHFHFRKHVVNLPQHIQVILKI